MQELKRHTHDGIDSPFLDKGAFGINQTITPSDGTLQNAVIRLSEIEAILKKIGLLR